MKNTEHKKTRLAMALSAIFVSAMLAACSNGGSTSSEPVEPVNPPVVEPVFPELTVHLEVDPSLEKLEGTYKDATTVVVTVTGTDGYSAQFDATLNTDGTWVVDLSGITFVKDVVYTATALATNKDGSTTAVDSDSYEIVEPPPPPPPPVDECIANPPKFPTFQCNTPKNLPVVDTLPTKDGFAVCSNVNVTGNVTFSKIFIPPNSTCVLNKGTTVENVVFGKNANLYAQGISVTNKHGLYVQNAGTILVETSTFNKNIFIENSGDVTLRDNTVGYNIKIWRNANPMFVLGNYVYNDIHLRFNTALATIEENKIGDDLRCYHNDPNPVGGNNQVALREVHGGKKEKQCVNL